MAGFNYHAPHTLSKQTESFYKCDKFLTASVPGAGLTPRLPGPQSVENTALSVQPDGTILQENG
jgi:hypothetical protein